MNAITLSICIPTYNFGPFIGETLDSIVPQLNEYVEVIIVDGASTDNTGDVVSNYAKKYPQINYVLLEERGGIDQDMAKSVEMANGKYCWIFSSDDVMQPDAICNILKELQSNFDVFL